MDRPFDVCWQRIARAKLHRDALGTIWNGFIEDEPYDPIVRVEADGSGTISIQQARPIPTAAALEIGEFLYQMRATLDACIYEAACVNTGRRPPPDEHRLEFPICEKPADFKRASWKIAPLTQEQRLILESVQPYNMPKHLTPDLIPLSFNRALFILNDWARKDRHRKLHVVATWASNIRPQIVVPAGTKLVDFNIADDPFVLRDESEVATFRIEGWRPDMIMEGNPNLSLDMAVDETPLPCHDRDTLGQRITCIYVAVSAIVEAVARTLGIECPPDYPSPPVSISPRPA